MSPAQHPVHSPPPPPPPPRDPSLILFVAALVPIGMSIAAAVTSIWCQDPTVAKTAWIAVAVVGSATMISTAVSTTPPKRPGAPDRKEDDHLREVP